MLASGSLVGRSVKAAHSVRETAALLGVSEDAVYASVRAGILPHKRVGRRIIIPGAALQKWLDASDRWDADGW